MLLALTKLDTAVAGKQDELATALAANADIFKSRMKYLKEYIEEDTELEEKIEYELGEKKKAFVKDHPERKEMGEDEAKTYQAVTSIFKYTNTTLKNLFLKIDKLTERQKRKKTTSESEYAEKSAYYKTEEEGFVSFENGIQFFWLQKWRK